MRGVGMPVKRNRFGKGTLETEAREPPLRGGSRSRWAMAPGSMIQVGEADGAMQVQQELDGGFWESAASSRKRFCRLRCRCALSIWALRSWME